MSVKVTGAQELAAHLARLADEAERLDLSRVGDQARAALEGASPRLTGALAQSWDVQAEPGRVAVGSDLVYAPIQNYGSSRVTGLHFVERSAELITDDAGRLVSQEIDRLIRRL